MTTKICVIGGGTAGWIAASYIKTLYKEQVEITIVYDHAHPVIGVGESTTPAIIDYLRVVDISIRELIDNIGATIKLGIKFENWNGDNEHYYHNFNSFGDIPDMILDPNIIAGYEIANNLNTGAETYHPSLCENNLVPTDGNGEINSVVALHIDGTLFSKFICDKFSSSVTVIDDIIVDVVITDTTIEYIIGKNVGKITADFFIDASGQNSFLLPKLGCEFIDKRGSILTDTAYTIQVPHNNTNVPPYTESVAANAGWFWKIPLKDRYGLGYVYSSLCATEEEAIDEFEKYLKNEFGYDIKVSDTPFKFVSGYFDQSWTGNCIAIGLASGFVEPLEATNIHMILNQLRLWTSLWNLHQTEWARKKYNGLMSRMYEQCYEVIQLHYHTKREDTKFWKKFKHIKAPWLDDYLEKCNFSLITSVDIYDNWDRRIAPCIFGLASYTRITKGLGLFNSEAIKKWLVDNNYYTMAEQSFNNAEHIKKEMQITFMTHDEFLNFKK
jgi:flavin-dependent dehydrogenase